MAKKTSSTKANKPRANRAVRPFPASSFEDAIGIANEIFVMGSGQPVRRLSLFDHLGKSPESGPSRQLITNASKYGLIKGSYQSEQLELTTDGERAVNEDSPERERTEARVRLAILNIEPFNELYKRFSGNKLPAKRVLADTLKEMGIAEPYVEEAVDTFIVNLRFTKLLQTLSGAERIVSLDHLLDSLPTIPINQNITTETARSSKSIVTLEQAGFDKTCFYIAPIGDDDSEHRKHSDLFLGSIVEPALGSVDISTKPNKSTRQVQESYVSSS